MQIEVKEVTFKAAVMLCPRCNTPMNEVNNGPREHYYECPQCINPQTGKHRIIPVLTKFVLHLTNKDLTLHNVVVITNWQRRYIDFIVPELENMVITISMRPIHDRPVAMAYSQKLGLETALAHTEDGKLDIPEFMVRALI